MKLNLFLKFLLDLNIFGETDFPFYDISGPCVNVNNVMPADKHACNWLPSLIYREETGGHRHFSQGYMACIRNTSGLSPKVFRMLWLDRCALVESSDSSRGK